MDESKTIYEAVNGPVLAAVPLSARRILDIGCGTGALGERLLDRQPCEVVGITYSEQEAKIASRRLAKVVCADLNNVDFSSLDNFDCAILSHILEHLYRPDEVLERLKRALHPQSVIVVALPNVLFWKQRREFLMGRWRYEDGGIMDRTHFRFFDYWSAGKLLGEAGYEIVATTKDGAFPLTRAGRKLMGPAALSIDRFACNRWPGLFACQFVYLAKLRNGNQ